MQALPQLHKPDIIIESAGAMSSPQSLDQEQEDMGRRANPIKGCWSVTLSLHPPNNLIMKTLQPGFINFLQPRLYLSFDNALLKLLLMPEKKEIADGLLDG